MKQKKQSMARTLAAMTAAILLSGSCLTGCQKRVIQTGATLDISLDNSYVSEEAAYPNGIDYIPTDKVGEYALCKRYINGITPDIRALMYKIEDNTYVELQNVSHPLSAGAYDEKYVCGAELEDGTWGCISYTYKWRGEEIKELTYYLDIYNRQGVLLESKRICDNIADMMSGRTGWWVPLPCGTDKEGNWYFSFNNEILIYDKNFTFKATQTFNGGDIYIMEMKRGASGDMYAICDGDDGNYLCRIDSKTLEMTRIKGFLKSRNTSTIATGYGETELFIADDTAIYGISIQEDTIEQKMQVDFLNSDYLNPYVTSIVASENGEFLTQIYTSTSSGGGATTGGNVVLRERTEEEKENMTLISLAGNRLPSQLLFDILNFNRSHGDTRFVVKDYSDGLEWNDNSGYQNMQQDMLDGILADVICTDGLPFQTLANKGMFADLTELMEADAEFCYEDYQTNFFDSMKVGDALPRIAFAYSINTVAAKTELVGTQEGRNAAEYADMLKNIPEDTEPFMEMHQGIVKNFLHNCMNGFVDWNKPECRFDDGAFESILHMGDDLISEDEYYQKTEYVAVSDLRYRENKVLLDDVRLTSAFQYHCLHQFEFGDEDVTLVGYPTIAGGNGGIFEPEYTISLCSKSDKKDIVWEYIKESLGEKKQNKLDNGGIIYTNTPSYFPVRRSSLEKAMQSAQVGGSAKQYSFNGGQPFAGDATSEEMETLKAYIDGITTCYTEDITISNIVNEEVEQYYAGDKPAADTAKNIQSRVSLYIHEQY